MGQASTKACGGSNAEAAVPEGAVARTQTRQQIAKNMDPAFKSEIADAVSSTADKDGLSPLKVVCVKLGGLPARKLRRVLTALGYVVESRRGVDFVRTRA